LIGQAQGGGYHGGGGGFGGGAVSAVVPGRDQLEAEAVSVVVASTRQPRRSVACQSFGVGSARRRNCFGIPRYSSFGARRHIGSPCIMDELADP